ncbi:hypothetical protein JS562_53525, partial [Agrobacterium sp. S2]|nr:hypothetical protein [Agrobacterium sp. S2]
ARFDNGQEHIDLIQGGLFFGSIEWTVHNHQYYPNCQIDQTGGSFRPSNLGPTTAVQVGPQSNSGQFSIRRYPSPNTSRG